MQNVIDGVIVRGLGEGTYFMSMQHYKKEIKKKLGFDAYPGTLNIKVGKKQLNLLKEYSPIKIEGYKSGSKILGSANCYRARIKGINGSIILPELTKHKDIVEFIAPVHVKSELKIRDGEKIKVEIA
ncbi:CTP-dependent riboflavin kinase [Candidatus Woesearchaeota archaeon]|nr:CTP-dependent riboflavin kinase [Candidatus Woesearchaeota archaeon]